MNKMNGPPVDLMLNINATFSQMQEKGSYKTLNRNPVFKKQISFLAPNPTKVGHQKTFDSNQKRIRSNVLLVGLRYQV